MAAFPAQVKVREVGPRDGFQNEPEVIPTEEKVRLIGMLADAGMKRIEVTSFVRADVIPQLADGAEVLEALDAAGRRDDVAYSVLIPNERGLDNALECRDRFDEISVFLSASETHNRKNVNRSIADSLEGLMKVVGRAREAGLRCEGVIATSFGCPYEGEVPRGRVLEIAERLREFGCQEIGFGDTTGMANPRQVADFYAHALDHLDGAEITAHFHNTRGQGLANALAALGEGVASFESSFGELGGCPVPPGSTGNISSEDLVSMLHEMGIETGVDLEALLAASRSVQEVLGRPLGAHLLTAGSGRLAHGAEPGLRTDVTVTYAAVCKYVAMKLPDREHTRRPWRIHDIAPEFELEDVWALPTPGGPDDFPRLVDAMASGDPEHEGPLAVRLLFALRWKIGALLGLDGDDDGVGARVPTLRDRVPADLRDRPLPDFGTLPFEPLYVTDDEFAAEIANRTMHGVMHLGWVEDPDGGYRGQMAVLVKPNGLLGHAYMGAIKPFRHLIVYPPMIRDIGRRWRRDTGDRVPPRSPAGI